MLCSDGCFNMMTDVYTQRDLVPNDVADDSQVFRFLLMFRWASLLPVVALWLSPGLTIARPPALPWVLLLLTLSNAIITVKYRVLNRLLQRFPPLLGLDLLLATFALALTGGVTSPFFFHVLSPILIAAFFFGLRGGFLAAVTFTPLYGLAILGSNREEIGLGSSSFILHIFTQLFIIYSVGIVFGYPAILLTRLRRQTQDLAKIGYMLSLSNDQLQRTNWQLRLLQELTLSLQSAVSPVELQEVLLQGLVKEVGYHGAVVAIADDEGRLGGWCWLRREFDRCHRHFECVVNIGVDSPVTRAVREQKPEVYPPGMPPTGVSELDKAIALQNAYGIFPLHLRGHPIGVLLVELNPNQTFIAPDDLNSLALVADHTSVALGSLRLCIERTQRLAAEEIRNRIAADIHDSVSQQLFGLAYGLNACNQLLAQNPEALPQVKAQLADLEPLAFTALHQMRSALWGLWSGGLDARRLASGLHRHMAALSMDKPVALDVRITPAFDSWPSELRHQLLLIAQEGIANIARHAQARSAQIVIAQDNGRVLVTIADDGIGFDPNRVAHDGGFGLESIRRRVERLGGTFCNETTPGQGARLKITIPLPRA